MKTSTLIAKEDILSWVTNELTKEEDVIIIFPGSNGAQAEITVLGIVHTLKEQLEAEDEPRRVWWELYPGTEKQQERGYVFGLVHKMKGDTNYLENFVEKAKLFNGEFVRGISYKCNPW